MYKSCFKNKKYCRNLSWKDFAGVEGFSITILDADTSEILGVACEGARCNENGLNNLDDFATFFVEVPPASVSKLILVWLFHLIQK